MIESSLFVPCEAAATSWMPIVDAQPERFAHYGLNAPAREENAGGCLQKCPGDVRRFDLRIALGEIIMREALHLHSHFGERLQARLFVGVVSASEPQDCRGLEQILVSGAIQNSRHNLNARTDIFV
jgi:hypothetical protein